MILETLGRELISNLVGIYEAVFFVKGLLPLSTTSILRFICFWINAQVL